MSSYHPRKGNYQAALSRELPESIASFLFGISAVFSMHWTEGGVTVRGISRGQAITYKPHKSSSRMELLEFFACVCGNRSLERSKDAEPVLCAFECALEYAFPDAEVHLEVVPVERSWCYELRVLITNESNGNELYFGLFWSVD